MDHTGRLTRQNKKGVIPISAQPLVERLGLSTDSWLDMVTGIEMDFRLRVSISGLESTAEILVVASSTMQAITS